MDLLEQPRQNITDLVPKTSQIYFLPVLESRSQGISWVDFFRGLPPQIIDDHLCLLPVFSHGLPLVFICNVLFL